MNHESFRTEIASQLMDLPVDQLRHVLRIIDSVALHYDITKLCTDLSVYVEPVPSAVKEYIASKAIQNCSKHTLDQYFRDISKFFETTHIKLDKVTTNDIRVYLYNYECERGVKGNTLDAMRRKLNGFFSWCVDDGYLFKNPAKSIGVIKSEDAVRDPLDPIQLEIIRGACTHPRDKFVIDFLYSTACRVQEFCDLLISDVNLTSGTIQIRHGKGNKYRVSYLNPESIVSLKAYLDSRHDDCPYLLVSLRKPYHGLTKRAVEDMLKKIEIKSGVGVHLFPHLMRHTAATSALSNGMPNDQVRMFLGHSNINTTLRYAKTRQEDVQASHRKTMA